MTEQQTAEKQRQEDQRNETVNENEKSLLASLIIRSTYGEQIPQLKIQSHCFYNTNHGLIFKIFSEQRKNGIKADIQTIGLDPTIRNNQLTAYVASLTNLLPSAANLEQYESEVLRAWQVRTAKAATRRFIKRVDGADFTGEIENEIRLMSNILSGALSDKHKNVFISFDDYINTQARKEYWREYTPRLFGTLPFPDGTISAIGAAPGGGKSAALVNLCRELLTTQPTNNLYPKDKEKAQDINAKRKILFISAEMSAYDIIDRLIHSLAWQEAGEGQPYYFERVTQTNKDYWKSLIYKYGKPPEYWEYSQEELQRAELYKSILEKQIRTTLNERLKIAYVRGLKCFDDIYNLILNNAEPGTLVLMDYLQLMPICNSDIGQGNPRYLEIRHVMDMGIIAAEKTQSVIIAAAQLGREDRKSSTTKQDDTQGWRESGDIEQTAWNLIKMTRNNEKLSFQIVKARSSEGVNTKHDLEWIPGYQYMTYKGKYTAPEKSNNRGTQIGSFNK